MNNALQSKGLHVSGLNVERGGRLVIDSLTFSVNHGEALLLTGPNGAGKTTLIRALAGLLPIAGGEVSYDEAESDASLPEYCHYVGHNNAAKADLTVRENLRFWAKVLGDQSSSCEAAIEQVGLSALADVPLRYLSAGQQRRVAVGRLLVGKRKIWLLDEPTVSLDAANVRRLVTFGNAHLAEGGIIVAATHIPLTFEPIKELQLEPVDNSFSAGMWSDFSLETSAGAGNDGEAAHK